MSSRMNGEVELNVFKTYWNHKRPCRRIVGHLGWTNNDGQFGVHDLHVESDTQKVINLIGDDTNFEISLIPLILDCGKLLLNFKKVKIYHIFQEINGVTDVLANEAV